MFAESLLLYTLNVTESLLLYTLNVTESLVLYTQNVTESFILYTLNQQYSLDEHKGCLKKKKNKTNITFSAVQT